MLKGHGNDGASGFEGVRHGNVIGTYLHGPLLPKNAWLADWLIARALGREQPLEPLDDALENAAHVEARRAPRRRVACSRTSPGFLLDAVAGAACAALTASANAFRSSGSGSARQSGPSYLALLTALETARKLVSSTGSGCSSAQQLVLRPLGVEPDLLLVGLEHHRHARVDAVDLLVRLRRDDRAGAQPRLSSSSIAGSFQPVQRPAKANGRPSARVMWKGCFALPCLCHS